MKQAPAQRAASAENQMLGDATTDPQAARTSAENKRGAGRPLFVDSTQDLAIKTSRPYYWQSAVGIAAQVVTGAPLTSVYVAAPHVPPQTAPGLIVVLP